MRREILEEHGQSKKIPEIWSEKIIKMSFMRSLYFLC